MKRILLSALAVLLMCSATAHAHVGSKDVYETVNAGPYKLFVTVRMPLVIPGIAVVEVRSTGAVPDSLSITPMPLTGEASKHPPTPDAMKRSADDAAFYTGSVWLMKSGSWQVRIDIRGSGGEQTASVPVAATPLSVLKMQRPLELLLGFLGLLLVVVLAGIVGAAVREARLAPGVVASVERRRRGWAATAMALVLVCGVVVLGNKWWNVEAAHYALDIYHPLRMDATLSGNTLELTIAPGEQKKDERVTPEKPLALDNLLLDHGKVMHLYAIREPEMDAVFHLHPAIAGKRVLRDTLPAMPPGTYRLYADIVMANGFPETLTATIAVPPGMSTGPLAYDDAEAMPPGISAGELGAAYKLPDGYTMVWDKPASLTANTATMFRFRLLDRKGNPASDEHLYLGMAGHAAFVKTDGTVFAHTHPDGSAAMPAMMLANGESPAAAMDGTPMAAAAANIPAEVEFPYGFPSAGRYRIFIQMKHGRTVETGAFDAEVR